MIITEYYKTREDGVVLNRTYSDQGMKIERDGDLYDEAIDPIGFDRQYNETDIPIDSDAEDATEADYQSALREMGVSV